MSVLCCQSAHEVWTCKTWDLVCIIYRNHATVTVYSSSTWVYSVVFNYGTLACQNVSHSLRHWDNVCQTLCLGASRTSMAFSGV